MIDELELDQALFKAVDEELEDALAPKRQELGVKDEYLEQHFAKMLEDIKQREHDAAQLSSTQPSPPATS